MTRDIKPGLLVLQGNRLELLSEAVFDWLGRAPLGPLEEEVFLVQSNGAAEWLKTSFAQRAGVCAATRVELPARFLWRAYRQMLGRAAVPQRSALDKDTLIWRLMRGLPNWVAQPGFEPVAAFLRGGAAGAGEAAGAAAGAGQAAGGVAGSAADRCLQLARRLADLLDQYQVYRADWLAAWGRGDDALIGATGQAQPLAADQRWQALLWRALLADLGPAERAAIRPQVHADFLAALARGQAPVAALPRRVVLFGAAHLSGQALVALAALATHTQVLLAVPNPCRYHWADILEGRELLRAARPRNALRGQRDLAQVPLAAMHGHAHPLLAAWGRQGRDFMRQLDGFDEAQHGRPDGLAIDLPRIDLFDDSPGPTMLTQLQTDIRDLLPLAELPARLADADDRSIVFHIAHSAQREVEILHDQLLHLLAPRGTDDIARLAPHGTDDIARLAPHGTDDIAPLAPRDVVVMVPDIERFAPAIRAVFGQHGADDARQIPFEITDLPRLHAPAGWV